MSEMIRNDAKCIENALFVRISHNYGIFVEFLVVTGVIVGASSASRLASGLPVTSNILKFLEKNRKF